MAAHGGTISIEAQRARAHADLRADRRRRRRRARSRERLELAERPLHRHRRHVLRHRADHRRATSRSRRRPTSRASCSTLPLVKIDSIGAGTGSFVRVNPNSNRPELGPDSAGARIGVCWPEGGLETISRHRPQPRARAPQPRLLPRRRHRARRRARASRGRARRSPTRSASSVERRRRRASIELFEQTLRTRRSGGSSARATRPSTTRCSATAAAGRCTSPATPRASPTATCSCRPGRRASRAFGCACARLRVPLRPDDRHADRAGGRGRRRRPASGHVVTAAGMGLRERVVDEFAKSGVARGRRSLHPLGADAVLRPAQRPRDRLAARGDRRRASRSTT